MGADAFDFGEAGEILPGGSGIIGPDGEWVAGPVSGKEAIIYGEINLQRTLEEKLLLDSVGHYNRPDVFKFWVDDRPNSHINWMSAGHEALPPIAPHDDGCDPAGDIPVKK